MGWIEWLEMSVRSGLCFVCQGEGEVRYGKEGKAYRSVDMDIEENSVLQSFWVDERVVMRV